MEAANVREMNELQDVDVEVSPLAHEADSLENVSLPGKHHASVDMAGLVVGKEEDTASSVERADNRNSVARDLRAESNSSMRTSRIPQLARKLSPPPSTYEPMRSMEELERFVEEMDRLEREKELGVREGRVDETISLQKIIEAEERREQDSPLDAADASSSSSPLSSGARRRVSGLAISMPSINEKSAKVNVQNDESNDDVQASAVAEAVNSFGVGGRRLSSTPGLDRILSENTTVFEPSSVENDGCDGGISAGTETTSSWLQPTSRVVNPGVQRSPFSAGRRQARASLRSSFRKVPLPLPLPDMGNEAIRRESLEILSQSSSHEHPEPHLPPSNKQACKSEVPASETIPPPPSQDIASPVSTPSLTPRRSSGLRKSAKSDENTASIGLSKPGAFAVSPRVGVSPRSRKSMPVHSTSASLNSSDATFSPRMSGRRKVLEDAKQAGTARRACSLTDQVNDRLILTPGELKSLDSATDKSSGLSLAPGVEPSDSISTPRSARRTVLEAFKVAELAGDGKNLGQDGAKLSRSSNSNESSSSRQGSHISAHSYESAREECGGGGAAATGIAPSTPRRTASDDSNDRVTRTLDHSSRRGDHDSDDSMVARFDGSSALSRQEAALPAVIPRRNQLTFLSKLNGVGRNQFARIVVVMSCLVIVAIVVGVFFAVSKTGQSDEPTEGPDTSNEKVIQARKVLANIVTSVKDLDDKDSPQNAAFAWIINDDLLAGIALEEEYFAPTTVITRYVLAVFYFSLGGPDWISSQGWLDSSRPVCGWQFVNCTDGAVGLEVDAIGPIRANKLKGYLPSEIRHLNQLRYLKLPNNLITGVGGTLGELVELDLTFNEIGGEIPSALFEMTSLEYLFLGSNKITGTIPSLLFQLTGLVELYLDTNSLTGTLSSTIGVLSDLEVLSMRKTNLDGRLSLELLPLKNLTYLDFSFNANLGGDFSEIFDGLSTNLAEIYVEWTGLGGTLPGRIGEYVSLKNLNIGRTAVSGTIPSEIGELKQLALLSVGQNQISGPIPSELGNLEHLRSLYLRGTLVTGHIPSDLGRLSNLRELDLANTLLAGELPPEVANMSSLESLVVANSGIYGELPTLFCELPQLSQVCIEFAHSNPAIIECNHCEDDEICKRCAQD